MRIRVISLITILVLAITAVSLAIAQGQRAAAPHDPHDLSGIWLRRGGGGSEDEKPHSEWVAAPLPFTPAGKEEFDSRSPGKGPRADLPAKGNDPLGTATVPGLLRTLVYGRPMQFIQTDDKVVQLFEWFRIWREIWTDGRQMPEDPGPRFYGYSVGKWEGDTFVVETYGLDPRLWGDEWGMPFSEQMRVTERWRRLDHDNMTMQLTFTDPVMYTKPWSTEVRNYRWQPKGTPNGEMLEVIFAPIDELHFNNVIRDLANGVPGAGQE
jgi:hypothetical protein